MTDCHYGRCRMVNLCKRTCVRWNMEQDGWQYLEGEFKPKDEAPASTVSAAVRGTE